MINHWLSLQIFFPVVAGGLLFGVGRHETARVWALAVATLQALIAWAAIRQFDPGNSGFQWEQDLPWIPSLNAHYLVGVDGLSVAFLPASALITWAVILASWNQVRTLPGLYYGLLLILQGLTVGVFTALDLVLFFLFWELTLVPVFFLVSLWGVGPDRRFAAMNYTLFMLIGGMFLLFGFIVLALETSQASGLSFDYRAMLKALPDAAGQRWIFLLLFLGFAAKAPLFPFHSWLPILAFEGPIGVTALITGLKLGVYGLMRFAFPLAPEGMRSLWWLPVGLGAATLIWGALVALRQNNLRKLLAFSSMSHVGLMVVALAMLNLQAVQGVVYQLVNFSSVAAGLFLLLGFLYDRVASSESVNLGGVAATMPRYAAFMLLLVVASVGLPGTNGFIAENLMITGILREHTGLGLLALLAAVICAGYMFSAYQRSFLGPLTRPAVRACQDLLPRETLIAGLFCGAILFFGCYPGLLLNLSKASCLAWIKQVGQVTDLQLAEAPGSE